MNSIQIILVAVSATLLCGVLFFMLVRCFAKWSLPHDPIRKIKDEFETERIIELKKDDKNYARYQFYDMLHLLGVTRECAEKLKELNTAAVPYDSPLRVFHVEKGIANRANELGLHSLYGLKLVPVEN